MRFRSRKMEATYRERRKLVAELLDTYPMCQRCMIRPSTEVHEKLSRARSGNTHKAILDRDNLAVLCHECHYLITTNPARAEREGWLLPSRGVDWLKHDESRPE